MTSKEMQIQESITENQQRLTQHLIKQNNRYRKALEFYATSGQAIGETKHGEVAREALGASE